MAQTRVRRTQAERTATTRASLLDATFDSIVELGYGATTTTEVAHRAGVSPGALLHHFPTKAELVNAAVAHAFDRRHEEFRKAMSDIDPGADKLDAAIDLLWAMFASPTFTACLELWVAARTDPEMAEAVIRTDRGFLAASQGLFAELFPVEGDFADPVFQRIGLQMAYALLDGLARSRLLPGYQPYATDEVLEAFKSMAHLALAMAQPIAADLTGGSP
ncbi:MAG: TetR/AcrR family transcriptional regulator [Acidimicrobiales bacterium]